MRYLITGAQGFAGRFLCTELLQADARATIVGTGRSTQHDTTFTHTITWDQRSFPAPLTIELRAVDCHRYRYISCDFSNEHALDSLLDFSQPEVVIHLAAALRDDAAVALVQSNVGATAALANALAKVKGKPLFILASSGSVYGVPQSLPLSENQRCAPDEPYAMTKYASEQVARVLSDSAGIPLIIARIFNIAGPGQDERHVCGRFAMQAAAIVSGNAPPILTVGDLSTTRDFIDVRDVARAIGLLAKAGTPGRIYNVASAREIAISEILERTLRAARLDSKVTITRRYSRAADIPRAYANITELQSCGFTPSIGIDQTITDLLNYYLKDVVRAASPEATTSATNSSETDIPSSQG